MDFKVEIARAEWRAAKMRELAALFEDRETAALAREMLGQSVPRRAAGIRAPQANSIAGFAVGALSAGNAPMRVCDIIRHAVTAGYSRLSTAGADSANFITAMRRREDLFHQEGNLWSLKQVTAN